MLKIFKKISDIADKISLFIASIMVLGILSVSIYGAFMRYIMNSPVPWPLPVGRLLMIWSGSIGIAAALKRGQHMGVDGLITRFPEKIEKAIRYIGFGFVFLFVLTLFWYGLWETYYARDLYMLTARTRISYRWLNSAIPVGAFIQLLHLLSAPYVVKEFMEKDYTETDIKTDGEIGL